MVQTFLEEKQSSYPAIAVLKRTDVLKLYIKINQILQPFHFYLVILMQQQLHCTGNFLVLQPSTSLDTRLYAPKI